MTWKASLGAVVVGLVLAALAAPPANAAETDTPKVQMKVVRLVGENEGPGEKTPYLGVNLSEETETPEGGARIVSVLDDSPAEKAGLKRGDIVVGFGDAVIRGPGGLTKRIHQSKAGDKVPLTFVRDGKKQTLTVEVGERDQRRFVVAVPGGGSEDITIHMPDLEQLDAQRLQMLAEGELERTLAENEKHLRKLELMIPRGEHRQGGAWAFAFARRPRLGVELVETTPDLREFLGGKKDAGVLVGKILTGMPAEKAGVRVGDLIVSVDGDAVEDSGDLIEALSEKEGKTVDLELVRDRKTMHLKVAIPEMEKDEPAGPRAHLEQPAPPVPPEPPEPPAHPAAAPMAHRHDCLSV